MHSRKTRTEARLSPAEHTLYCQKCQKVKCGACIMFISVMNDRRLTPNDKKKNEKIASILDLRRECKGKTVVIIGDIHGCYDELSELLDSIDWSPQTHVLILTGDLIDRGPKIKETLQFATHVSNIYSLMSNHEWKLLRYLKGRPVKTQALTKPSSNVVKPF